MPEAAAAALAGAFRLPPQLPPALIPIVVIVVGLDAFCLVDLARSKTVRNLPKPACVVVILVTSSGLGALAYLFWGRDRGHGAVSQPPGGAAAGPAAPEPTAGPVRSAPGPQPASAAQDAEPARPARDAQPSTTGQDAQQAGLVVTTAGLTRDDAEPARPARDAQPTRPVVTTTGLTRNYGGTGLFDVDLRVPQGCVYGLVGPNGAGKTTLLSILSGLRRPDRGTVTWALARSQVAVCPDVPEFEPWLTAYEVVDLARSLSLRLRQRTGDAAAALALAGLADSASRRVGGFSRGMLQRVGLACSLVTDPELLILDEPTAALDPAGRAEILGLVAAMRGQRTVIFSSHILADVQRIADHVGILRGGRLLYQGATQELIDTYLRPSWLVRIAGDATPVLSAIAGQPWAERTELVAPDALRVDAATMEEGERGIPAVIAACGARQVSCEPVAADLESAFLALTSEIGEVAA